jgi:hypothetical protein
MIRKHFNGLYQHLNGGIQIKVGQKVHMQLKFLNHFEGKNFIFVFKQKIKIFK